MFGKQVHYFQDSLDQTYAFSVWPLSDGNNHPRKEEKFFGKTYAKQTFACIVDAFRDPCHYGLLDLWLEVYQRPWARPRSLHQLIDELADKVASGELKVYLVDSPVWRRRDSGAVGEGSVAGSGGDSGGAADSVRTGGGGSAQGSSETSAAIASSAGVAAVAALSLADRRGLPPASLDDAVDRLASMAEVIKQDGYQPKYSDDELLDMAESGKPVNDRFVVRFSPAPSVDGKSVEPESYEGPMGHMRDSGRHPLWMSTFDQIEAADTDPALIAAVFGTKYDPNKDYVLYVIDRGADHEINGSDVFVPTFANMQGKLKEEFAGELDPAMIDKVMTEEYAEEFRQHWGDFNDYLDKKGLNWTKSFEPDYADAFVEGNPSMAEEDADAFLARQAILAEIGAFEIFTGNGLTERSDAPGRPGALETLEIQHQPESLKKVIADGKAKAIKMPKS